MKIAGLVVACVGFLLAVVVHPSLGLASIGLGASFILYGLRI